MSSKLKIDTRVRSLKVYLQEFEKGSFQIPSFQRDFLWSQDDIKELFDSIRNNYPIGSILFWKPLENSTSWKEQSNIGPYTIINDNQNNDPVYILDGFQRLSSLFGCLTNPKKFNEENLKFDQKKFDEKFNLFYDLEEEQFVYLRQNSKNLFYQIPVYIFMNSIDFRQYARKEFEKIDNEKDIEKYYDRADALGQIFTNYQIASVDITDANIEEAVEIFRRVNEKGLPISKDWIVSAITNQGDFRLGTEIDNLLNELKQYNFEHIKRDVIFQCIQNSFGKIYFDYKIEDLVKRDDFIDITRKTIENIKKAVKFLYEHLAVLNSKLIPYNSQLIFITTFFNSLDNEEPTENQILSLKKWFWTTSYSNYFTIYSLSNQRRAFEQFTFFINDENIDPIYNNEKSPFFTQEFPQKIFMGSVRAKALALFLINYYLGFRYLGLDKIDSQTIEKFEIGNLFSISQKDNPVENFIPLITTYPSKNNSSSVMFKQLNKLKSRKNHSFLLEKENDKLFISNEIVKNYKLNINQSNILDLRRNLIIKAEKEFVSSLGLIYQEPLPF